MKGEEYIASAKDDLRFLELKDTIFQLNITISSQNELIKSLNTTIAGLNEQIDYLKKKLYGSSSEKRDKDFNYQGQLSLFDDVEVSVEEIELEFIEVKYKREHRLKPTLKDQFEKLTVREVIVDTLSDEDKIYRMRNANGSHGSNIIDECKAEYYPHIDMETEFPSEWKTDHAMMVATLTYK